MLYLVLVPVMDLFCNTGNEIMDTCYQIQVLIVINTRNKSSEVIPVTMETRSSKVIFPNYSKKKPAEDTLVPPLWGTRGKNVRFSRIICSRCCTRRNLRFHVENCQHAHQNSSRNDRPSISTYKQPTANPVRVEQGR